MQFQSNLKILGMKASKGTFEGVSFDSTRVYVEVPLDDSKGNAKGFASAEYVLGLSTEYEKFKDLNFPFEAKATLEIVTTGKMQKTQMISLQPLGKGA